MSTAWAKKHRGRVANYCAICRDVQRHAFGYLYDHATRRSQQAIECQGCGLMSGANADEFLAIKGDDVTDIAILMEQTHPMLPLSWWKRIAYDKGLIAGDLPASERAMAVREPFQILEYLGHRVKKLRAYMVRLCVAGPCLLGIGLMVLLAQLAHSTWRNSIAWPVAWYVAASAAAMGGCIMFLRVARRGVTHRQILPMLARSLRPLRPTTEELASVFDWMKKTRFVMAGLVSQEGVEAEIKRSPDRSFTSFDADTLLRMAQAKETEMEDARRRQIPGVAAPSGENEGQGTPEAM